MANLYKTAISTSAPAWTRSQSPSFPSLNLLHNPHSVFVVSCTITYFISLLLKGKLPKRRTDHNLFITLICSRCLMKYLCSNFLPLCLLLLSLWHKYTFSRWYLYEISLSINDTLKCHLFRTLKHVISSSENMATNIPLFSLETVTAVFVCVCVCVCFVCVNYLLFQWITSTLKDKFLTQTWAFISIISKKFSSRITCIPIYYLTSFFRIKLRFK